MAEYKMNVFERSTTYTQENDCCDLNSMGQQLIVKTQDGGGGSYLVIETERWSIDREDIDTFCVVLKQHLEGLD